MSKHVEPAPELDPAQVDLLGRFLGTATPADTVRSAVEFTLRFAELARATSLYRCADPSQLDLLQSGRDGSGSFPAA
jgi:hypothetical protein